MQPLKVPQVIFNNWYQNIKFFAEFQSEKNHFIYDDEFSNFYSPNFVS